MSARQRTKEMLKETFPSIWVHWHLMHHPKSADPELLYLDRIVPEGAVTVDVGANCGLYTRKLARLSRKVHAFEPSRKMADLLRRTSASNVSVHEIALSDQTGSAELFIPQNEREPVYGLASLEPRLGSSNKEVVSINVPTARLDAIVHQDVAFVKIDVEGHELNVLNGAVELLEHSQPVFLVEAEDRHRVQATRSIFEFFERRSYRGFFLKQGNAIPIDQFRPADLQDASALLPDGGRKSGQSYVNNFFFFPQHLDGESILNS
ncbi:methyltransferase, FkbM family [Bradyrhizobium erythrophlei]|jgi:FkbM family methyltransferase|uniref:Methyltransferase, FkbM family n=2 Tax=Bradyrhizobium erythrophlei TaxID=1437360 RepID=A0A1M5KL87_9BRAD|nr:methyltransferase, FkbM family [Bradyrhizobium erythrophlei]